MWGSDAAGEGGGGDGQPVGEAAGVVLGLTGTGEVAAREGRGEQGGAQGAGKTEAGGIQMWAGG